MPDAPKPQQTDEDATLGAVEADPTGAGADRSDTSLSGQLGHRDQDELLKDSDTDFPEPDAAEEFTGESSGG